MPTARRLVIGLTLAACLSPVARADEGMWMPQQIPLLAARLAALGFTGDVSRFADLTGHPMGAVVSLGGCTASFVSPDALIVTNHHCVTGGLQFNSTPERNLLLDGYVAKTRADELPSGPGSRVFVTTSVTDVTEAITGNLPAGITDLQRQDQIDRRIKERVTACERGGQRCSVPAFFGGLKYFEIAQLEIQDVRLVYAPADGIGVFGGETDNWRWPRHTGDWSFLRAYVGPDGKPAPYSKANVPYKPAHFLKVSPAGARPDELVFVVGYPGRTQRHQTYEEVRETTEWSFPRTIGRFTEQLAIIDALVKQTPALSIVVAGRVQGLNNSLTNIRGMHEGLVAGGSLARKKAQQDQLAAWIDADPSRRATYGDVLPALTALQAAGEKTRERDAVLGNLASASGYLGAAQTLYRLAGERAKSSDLDRDAGFQQRDWSRIREVLDRQQRSFDPTVDRALFRWALGLAAALPADQRIAAVDKAAGLKPGMPDADAARAIDGWLDGVYAKQQIGNRDVRLGWFENSRAELDATKDPFIGLAAALTPLADATREASRTRAGANARLRPRYMAAMLAQTGGQIAPDANSTLRVTFGEVKGVMARDGLFYTPQTGLSGIVEKHTGKGDFIAPKTQLDAIAAFKAGKFTPYRSDLLGDVPVNFLSTVDTTGGNSGSPTINARGELVGLLFDGTYDSVASNYLFDPIKTRSIHVDSRYMLWTMTEVDGARHLVDEMGIR